MDKMIYDDLLLYALKAAYYAGEGIIEIYNSSTNINVEYKEDNSPLTKADKKSNEIITSILSDIMKEFPDTNIPILSEEGKEIPYTERKNWNYFWLIDPLDGTKEFINRNGEFTVNIALIHQNKPVLGVVYVPVTGKMYYSLQSIGSYLADAKEMSSLLDDESNNSDFCIDSIIDISQKLPLEKSENPDKITVIASRSHMNDETKLFIEKLKSKYKQVELISAGSSLKLCYVAEGKADIYPRIGPTMEWDTAAAHAVVNGAGKAVINFNSGEELVYNKEDLLNDFFVVAHVGS